MIARLLLLAGLLVSLPAQARPAPPPGTPVDAFVAESPDPGGLDTLFLVNLLTGETEEQSVTGRQYSMVGDEVVFLDDSSGRVQAVSADGALREHPLIQPAAGARRIDLAYSPLANLVAWTVTEGTPDALTTTTYVASPEGAGARMVLRDGPRPGIRAFPIGFSDDGATLYMDYQPDTIADLAPLRQYAAMFALDLASGALSSLPGEASCYCGGAVGSGQFARLALADAGFDLRVTDLASNRADVIDSLGLAEYTQAGDMLLSPDGSKAFYTLLQLVPGGAPGEVRVVYVVADLVAGRQRALNADSPDERLLRPVGWSNDGSAVLLTDPTEPGTWRLDLFSGETERVADASFIGSTVAAPAVR